MVNVALVFISKIDIPDSVKKTLAIIRADFDFIGMVIG
jgi:hypothetical protein